MSEQFEITSIVITHDMHSVLQIAEKVVFLDQKIKLAWDCRGNESSTDESLLDLTRQVNTRFNCFNWIKKH